MRHFSWFFKHCEEPEVPVFALHFALPLTLAASVPEVAVDPLEAGTVGLGGIAKWESNSDVTTGKTLQGEWKKKVGEISF